jgi:hypothetical protein
LIGGKGEFTRSLQTCIITAFALLSEVQRASSTSCLAVVAKEGWVGWEIHQDGFFLYFLSLKKNRYVKSNQVRVGRMSYKNEQRYWGDHCK